MTLTEQEARKIAVQCAEEALERFRASEPRPSTVTLKQAAEMLGVSENTARKYNLRRNAAGRIPYEAVLEARASR